MLTHTATKLRVIKEANTSYNLPSLATSAMAFKTKDLFISFCVSNVIKLFASSSSMILDSKVR